MSGFSAFFEGIWSEVTEAADSVWDAVVSLFKSGATKAAAVLKSFVQSFAENVDDILIAAATAGYESAKEVDGTWIEKLSAAVEKATEELGDQAVSYAKTDIINAIQAVYVDNKTTNETEENE